MYIFTYFLMFFSFQLYLSRFRLHHLLAQACFMGVNLYIYENTTLQTWLECHMMFIILYNNILGNCTHTICQSSIKSLLFQLKSYLHILLVVLLGH